MSGCQCAATQKGKSKNVFTLHQKLGMVTKSLEETQRCADRATAHRIRVGIKHIPAV